MNIAEFLLFGNKDSEVYNKFMEECSSAKIISNIDVYGNADLSSLKSKS